MNISWYLVPLVVVLTLASTAPATAQDASPSAAPATSAVTVVPPDQYPLEIPYAEWAARWWSWIATQPAETNPLVTGDCQAGQGGEVFFIPHTSPGSDATSECVVAADQSVLASAGGTIWDTTGGCAGTDTRAISRPLCWPASRPTSPSSPTWPSSSMGKRCPTSRRSGVASPVFDIQIPEGNIFEVPPQTAQAAVGGWFVMLEPLAPGKPHRRRTRRDRYS